MATRNGCFFKRRRLKKNRSPVNSRPHVSTSSPKPFTAGIRNHLSDYKPDIEQGKWHPKFLEHVEVQTGEITRGKPLYVFDRGKSVLK